MRNGSTYLKNLKDIIYYPKKMILIGLVRPRTTSLGSCVFALGQDLGMRIIFFMVELVVFHLFDINRLTKVMREPVVLVET